VSGSSYEAFIEMADHLMLGLVHILDDEDIARVDGVVNDIAIRLGERLDAWDGAGNLALMVAENLIPEGGPWTMPEAQMRANTIVCCFIMVRLMAHPMMKPVLRKWSREEGF